MGLDSKTIHSKMLQVQKSLEWSEEQLAALSDSPRFKGPLQILQGPPGSGKTQLLAGRALFFAMLGFSILVCAPSTPIARAFAACLMKLRLSAAMKDQIDHLEVVELFTLEPVYDSMKTGGKVPSF